MTIPLGRPLPDASRDLPGWRRRKRRLPRRFPGGRPSLCGLAPGGVCPAATVTGGAVRSYRTLSPLPLRLTPRPAVCSLWHCPWGRPRRVLPGTVFSWSPDFPRTFRPAVIQPSGEGRGRERAWESQRFLTSISGAASEVFAPRTTWPPRLFNVTLRRDNSWL